MRRWRESAMSRRAGSASSLAPCGAKAAESASRCWSTRPTPRWPRRRSGTSPGKRNPAGDRCASPCTIASAGSRSETMPSSSRSRRRIAPKPLRRAASRSTGSRRSSRSGRRSTPTTGRSGSKSTRSLAHELAAIVGRSHVLANPTDLLVYEYDAGFDRAMPALVVAPGTSEETAAVVAACSRAQVPLVARGTGTGLAGGAIAPYGVVVSTARLRRILEIDIESRAALVEAGVVTKAWLRLLPEPEVVRTFLTFFADVESGAGAATAIIAEGIVPAALEMMDAPTIRAVNAAFDAHLPSDAGSLLLVELEGPAEECDERHERIVAICRRAGATDVKTAANENERALLWKARKLGYPALARLAPNNYLMDGVVPRTKLPETLRQIAAIAERYDMLVANMFHIGDGNLHPTLLFDAAVPGMTEKAIEASALILKHCVAVGGALSGEHGIGVEKNQFMRWVFSAADLDAMRRVRDAFDPTGRMNPGKIFPTDEPPRELPLERLKFRFAEDMWV